MSGRRVMSGRRAAVLVGSLALAAGGALAALPVTVAGASSTHSTQSTQSTQSKAHQHAVCGAVARGYARCLAHVVETGTPQGHGPGPASTTPRGYGPSTIAKAYEFSTAGGAGQTIGIVDAYGAPTVTSNLQTFSSQFGLPACGTATNGCFTKVNQSGGTSYPRSTSGWALEQSLDVEWAHSLAPYAKVLLVEATTSSFTNLLTAVSYAAAHANYVSMSWGGTEFSGESSYDSTYFSKAGVSYFAAAGDTGSEVIYPSVSPDVVSVGGTTLHVTTNGTWKTETAWKTAGGGCSTYEKANTAQAAYKTYPNVGCNGQRATPDISLDANPTTGVSVYDTERLSTGQSGWLQVGGTSASTVMVAAHAAETTQPLSASTLYGGTLKVYDVTSGSNGHPCTLGYDLCTGLGSWNTAVGTTAGSTSGSSSGTLSFTPGTGQTLTAGSPSTAITVKLSAPAPSTGLTVTLTTSTGGFATSSTATSFSSSLTLKVAATSSVTQSFYYESTKTGTHTITASATGWTSATQTETVSAVSSLSASLSAGTPSKHGPWWHTPLTVSATEGGSAVSGASVQLAVYGGPTCSTLEATGTGTTGSNGTVVFTFKTRNTGSYCAAAVVSSGGQTAKATTTFTVS